MCHVVHSDYKWCFTLYLSCVTTLVCMLMNTATLSDAKHVSLLTTCSIIKPPYSINDISIKAMRLSIVSPPSNISRFNNNGTPLKPSTMCACTLHHDWLLILVTPSQLTMMYLAFWIATFVDSVIMWCIVFATSQFDESLQSLWSMFFTFKKSK